MDPEVVSEHREVLRQMIQARDLYVQTTGRGPRAPYGVAFLGGLRPGFRVLTLHSSIGCAYGDLPLPASSPHGSLTAGMLESLSRQMMYVQGSTPAMVEAPPPGTDPSLPVAEMQLLLLAYPYSARPLVYNAFTTSVFPEHCETEPLYVALAKRPDGWPR